MRRIDDINKIFRLMDSFMNDNFSGGYYTNIQNDKEDDLAFTEDDKHIYLTLELKGVRDEDLTVIPKLNSIYIRILLDGEEIEREYTFPMEVNPKTAKVTFNNFILDVVLTKKKKRKK